MLGLRQAPRTRPPRSKLGLAQTDAEPQYSPNLKSTSLSRAFRASTSDSRSGIPRPLSVYGLERRIQDMRLKVSDILALAFRVKRFMKQSPFSFFIIPI